MNRRRRTTIAALAVLLTCFSHLFYNATAASAAECAGRVTTDIGTNGDDILSGDEAVDSILALAGSDDIFGHGSGDYLCGNDGRDVVWGQAGADTLRGNEHCDAVIGGDGPDSVSGNNGDDFNGFDGNTCDYGFVIGEAGNDDVFGNGGNDYLDGGGATDSLNGGDGFQDFCKNGESNINCEVLG